MVSRRMYSVGVDKLESVAIPSIDTSRSGGANEFGNSVISLTSPSNPTARKTLVPNTMLPET